MLVRLHDPATDMATVILAAAARRAGATETSKAHRAVGCGLWAVDVCSPQHRAVQPTAHRAVGCGLCPTAHRAVGTGLVCLFIIMVKMVWNIFVLVQDAAIAGLVIAERFDVEILFNTEKAFTKIIKDN